MKTISRHTIETAQERCRDDFKILKWHGVNIHCQVECLKCGLVSVSFGGQVVRGVFKCPCSRKPRPIHRLTIETAQERCRDDFKILKWHGSNIHCQVECLKCGLVSVSFGGPVVRGIFKCPCSRKPGPWGHRPKLTEDQINHRLAERGIELIGTYRGSHGRAKWRCTKCGHVWAHARAASVLHRGGACQVCHPKPKKLKHKKDISETTNDPNDEFALLDAYILENKNQKWYYE